MRLRGMSNSRVWVKKSGNTQSEQKTSALPPEAGVQAPARTLKSGALGQLDRQRIVRIKPGVAVLALVLLGEAGADFGLRLKVEQLAVGARLQHDLGGALDAVALVDLQRLGNRVCHAERPRQHRAVLDR